MSQLFVYLLCHKIFYFISLLFLQRGFFFTFFQRNILQIKHIIQSKVLYLSCQQHFKVVQGSSSSLMAAIVILRRFLTFSPLSSTIYPK